MDPPGGQLERESSFKSAGDRLSRESSFASVGEAFGATPSREGYASPDRQNLEGFTYQPDFPPPEITASPVPPEEKPAPAGLERFFSARPAFDMLFRRGSLDSTLRSQDLSGFIKAEGLRPPEEGGSPPAGALVGSASSPDFRRTVSVGSPRRYSGPLAGLDPLANEEEDYTFVRKWGAHEGVSPSVRSSSIGGRSSSREVMMWMGEAGMLDEEDEVIIHDETKPEPRKEEPRPAFGWWPFGRRRSQEGSNPASPNTSQELGPHSEPSAESVAGPQTQPLDSEPSAGSLRGRLVPEESLSSEIGLPKAAGGATRSGGVQRTTGAAFAAKAVGEALSFEGGAEAGEYVSLGINDSGKSETTSAAEAKSPGIDEAARRAAGTAGYFSLGINDSADDAGASVGAKVKARLAAPRLESPAPRFPSAAPRASFSSQEDVKMMVSGRPPSSAPSDLTPTSLNQSTGPTETSRSVRQDGQSLGTRLGPVNTAFFASQGMQPPGVSRELRFVETASTGQQTYPPVTIAPLRPVNTTPSPNGPAVEVSSDRQLRPASAPESPPSSELDVDEPFDPWGSSSALASVDEEMEVHAPGELTTPRLLAVETEGQGASEEASGGVKSPAENRGRLSASLGPVNTAFFRSQGMEPPGSSGTVAQALAGGRDFTGTRSEDLAESVDPADIAGEAPELRLAGAGARSVNIPPEVKGAGAGMLEGVHTAGGPSAPGSLAATEPPVTGWAEGVGQDQTVVVQEGVPRAVPPAGGPEAFVSEGGSKGVASEGRSEGLASNVEGRATPETGPGPVGVVVAKRVAEDGVAIAPSSKVVRQTEVGTGDSAIGDLKHAGKEATGFSTGGRGAGDSAAETVESNKPGPGVATLEMLEGKELGAGNSTTAIASKPASEKPGSELGAKNFAEPVPQVLKLGKSEPSVVREGAEAGVTEGAAGGKSLPGPNPPTNPLLTPETAASASLSAVPGIGAVTDRTGGGEAIPEQKEPVKEKVSSSRAPEAAAVGPTVLQTVAAVGAAGAGVGVAATAGRSKGDEASEAGSGTSKKSKSSQWKRFKSLFGRKGAKGEPTPSREERAAPGLDAQRVSKAAAGAQEAQPGQLERDESDDVSWAGSVKEEEPPPGWTESGEGFGDSSSQRASSLGPSAAGEEAEVESVKQERALGMPDERGAEKAEVKSLEQKRAVEVPVVGQTAGGAAAKHGTERPEAVTGKAGAELGAVESSEGEAVRRGVSGKELGPEMPVARGGEVGHQAANDVERANAVDEEGTAQTEGLSAPGVEETSAETEAAQPRAGPVGAADGEARESAAGASEQRVTGNVTAQNKEDVATVPSGVLEDSSSAPNSQPSAWGPLGIAEEGIPQRAAESTRVFSVAPPDLPVSAAFNPGAADRRALVDPVGADPKLPVDPPGGEVALKEERGVPILRGSVSARIRALEQLAAGGAVSGVSEEPAAQKLTSLGEPTWPPSAQGERGVARSAEVPLERPETSVEPLGETGQATGSAGAAESKSEAARRPVVVEQGELLREPGLRDEFAASKTAVWGDLEDDDEVTMEVVQSPGRGETALEIGGFLQEKAARSFGQEGTDFPGGLAAPEAGSGLLAAPGRVAETGASAFESKQPGYLVGDVIAADVGRKPQDPITTQRSESPVDEPASKPERPLPQLERSPSPEIPRRWGEQSPEPSPFASFGGVSNAPRDDAASFGGVSGTPRGAPFSETGTPTPTPASFGGIGRAFPEPPYGDLRALSTPTPSSTPTTTLVQQSGFPPGAVKAMAKQSPRESGGVPIPGFATPPMRVGTPEPSSFDAGFAKLRINLEAYQSPPDVVISPRTSKRPPSPAVAPADASFSRSSVGGISGEQPTKAPAVQLGMEALPSAAREAGEAERSQLAPGLETRSFQDGAEEEMAEPHNEERDVSKRAPALEATPSPGPSSISTAQGVLSPTPPASSLAPAPFLGVHAPGTTNTPVEEKSTPQVALESPLEVTQPDTKTPGSAGVSHSSPGVPSPTDPAGPVKPAREEPPATPAEGPVPPVPAPEQPVVSQAPVSEPGAQLPTTPEGFRTPPGAAREQSPDSSGVVSTSEGQLPKVPATSEDLGDLIKIAEAHLGEARRKLAAASFNGREADNDQVGEDQASTSKDAPKGSRALSAAAAAASAGAATLVAAHAAKGGASASKALSSMDGNQSDTEEKQPGIAGKRLELEGKAQAAAWLATEGSPVSVARQQLAEERDDPLARVEASATEIATGGLNKKEEVPPGSGSGIGGPDLAPDLAPSGAEEDKKWVAQLPVVLSAAMQAEIGRARREVENIKAALDAAEGKKKKGGEGVVVVEGGERKTEVPGAEEERSELFGNKDGTLELLVGGKREKPVLVAGIKKQPEGPLALEENWEGSGEAMIEGAAAIGVEVIGASTEERRGLNALAGSVELEEGEVGATGEGRSGAGVTQISGHKEGPPFEALAVSESGLKTGPPKKETAREAPVAQVFKPRSVTTEKEGESSTEGVTLGSASDGLVGPDSPGTEREDESEGGKAAGRKRVSFSDVETLHEIERLSTESEARSSTGAAVPALTGAGLLTGLGTGSAGRLAPIPEVNRTYSLSTGYGTLQPHSRRRGISVESDAEQARRETPTVLADPWESEEGRQDSKGRAEDGKAGAVLGGALATGLGAGAAGLLVARSAADRASVTGAAAKADSGSIWSKSGEAFAATKSPSAGGKERAAVVQTVPEKEGASRSVVVGEMTVPDARESAAVSGKGPEPDGKGSESRGGPEEVPSVPKSRSVAPSGWAAILGWPSSDEAKAASPPVSVPLAGTVASSRSAEAAAQPQEVLRGVEGGKKEEELKVDAGKSVLDGIGGSAPMREGLAGVSTAKTTVQPEELSRESGRNEKFEKADVGAVEGEKTVQVLGDGVVREGVEKVQGPEIDAPNMDEGTVSNKELALGGGERENAGMEVQESNEMVESGASAAAEVKEIEAEAASAAGAEELIQESERSVVREGNDVPASKTSGPVLAEGAAGLGAGSAAQMSGRGVDATAVNAGQGKEGPEPVKAASGEADVIVPIAPGGSAQEGVSGKIRPGEEEEAAGVPMPRRREGLALAPAFPLAPLLETGATVGAAESPAASGGASTQNVTKSVSGDRLDVGPVSKLGGPAGVTAVDSGDTPPGGLAALPSTIPTETGDFLEVGLVQTGGEPSAERDGGRLVGRDQLEKSDVADVASGGDIEAPASGLPTEAPQAVDVTTQPRGLPVTGSVPPGVVGPEGPVSHESVTLESVSDPTGTKTGPSMADFEAPGKQASPPTKGGLVSAVPLLIPIAASVGAAEALRPPADAPAQGLALSDGSPNRALKLAAPDSELGKDLQSTGRAANESPKPRHAKKKLKASEGGAIGLAGNTTETTELNPSISRPSGPKVLPAAEATSENTGVSSAQAVLIQEEALAQSSAPVSAGSVSQTTAVKPSTNPHDSPSVTSKVIEAPVTAASPGNEIEEIEAVAPATPPPHSKARRHRFIEEPLGGEKQGGARSAKSLGRVSGPAEDSPVRGLTRRQGSASPGRQSPRTPRLKIVSPSASPGRSRTPSEVPRTPSTIGRRTRLTNLSSRSFKPRAAQIAPVELRGEKEDTSIKNVLSSWEEEESNFLRTQMAGSRLIRERKAAAAEQAALAAAGLPPRPRSSSRVPPTEGPGESLSPELFTRPFTTPPVSEIDGRRKLEAQLRLAGSELREASGGVVDGRSFEKALVGRSDGESNEKRSWSLEEWKELQASKTRSWSLGEWKELQSSGPKFGSVSLPKGLDTSSKPAPVAETGANRGVQTGLGGVVNPASQTLRPVNETEGFEQGVSIGLASNERALGESKNGRALPTSAVPEPQESLWEDQGTTPGAPVGPRAETLPKEMPSTGSKPEKPARTHKKRQFLKDLFRRKKKDKSPPPSEPALVFRPIPPSLAPPTPTTSRTQTQSLTPALNQTQTQTQTPRLPPLILLSSQNPTATSGANPDFSRDLEDGTIERRGRGLDLLIPTIEIPATSAGPPADVSSERFAPPGTAGLARSLIGKGAEDPSPSSGGLSKAALAEEKTMGFGSDVSKVPPTPGRDVSPAPTVSFAAGYFSPRQISAKKPPLSPASKRVAKPAGASQKGAPRPSSLSPGKEEGASDTAWKLNLPSGLPTAAERAQYESGSTPAGSANVEGAESEESPLTGPVQSEEPARIAETPGVGVTGPVQTEEPAMVAETPGVGALTAGEAATAVLTSGAAVAGGLTAGAAAAGVLTAGAAAAGVLTAGAVATAGVLTAGALEAKAESEEGAASKDSGLAPVDAGEAVERTGGSAGQAEPNADLDESGEPLAIPSPLPSASSVPRLEDLGGGEESPVKVTPRSVLPTNEDGESRPGGQLKSGEKTSEAKIETVEANVETVEGNVETVEANVEKAEEGRVGQSPGKSRLGEVAPLVLPVSSTAGAVGNSLAAGGEEKEQIIAPKSEGEVAEKVSRSLEGPNRESVKEEMLLGDVSQEAGSGSAAAVTDKSDVSQAPSDVNPVAAIQERPAVGTDRTQALPQAVSAVAGQPKPVPVEQQGKAVKRKKGAAAGDPSAPRSPKPVSKWLRGVFFWGSKSPGSSSPLSVTEPPQEVTSVAEAVRDPSVGQSRSEGVAAPPPVARQRTWLTDVSVEANRNPKVASPPAGPMLGSFAKPATSTESAQKGSAAERNDEVRSPLSENRSQRPVRNSELVVEKTTPKPSPRTSEPAVQVTPSGTAPTAVQILAVTANKTPAENTSPEVSQSTANSGDVSSSGDSAPLFQWRVGTLPAPPPRGPKGSVENAFDDDSASGGSLSAFTGGAGKGSVQNAMEDDSTATSGGKRVAALAAEADGRLQVSGSPNSVRTIKAFRGVPLQLNMGAEEFPSPKPQAKAEFPLRYMPSDEVLNPPSPGGKGSPRGATSAGSGAPALNPLSASKSRNLGTVPEEDIVAALEKEKSKQGGFLEPLWGRKEGVVKATSGKSKSRSRKKTGDIVWGSAKGSPGEKGEKLLAPEMVGHGVGDYGDQKGGELRQEVAAHPKKGLGEKRSPLGKPSASRRRAYDWKQHVEVALRNDDTWRLTGEEKETMPGVHTLEAEQEAPRESTPDSSMEFLEIPGPSVVLPSPRKAAVTRALPTGTEALSPREEKKAKLVAYAQGEESAGQSETDSVSRRKPAIPFLYEQAMAAAYEPSESGKVVKKDQGKTEKKVEPVDSEAVKWPAMDADEEPTLIASGAGIREVV